MLEGKNPQDVAVLFEKALRTRSTRVADAMGRLELIPAEKRTENVKKFLPQIYVSIAITLKAMQTLKLLFIQIYTSL